MVKTKHGDKKMKIELELRPEEIKAIKNLLDGKPSGLTNDKKNELKKYLSHK